MTTRVEDDNGYQCRVLLYRVDLFKDLLRRSLAG